MIGRQPRRWLMVGAACAAMGMAASASAEVFKCAGPDGRIEYRSQPCRAGDTSRTMPGPTSERAAPAAPLAPLPATSFPRAPRAAGVSQNPGAQAAASREAAPPRDLAEGAEIIVVSGYEPSKATTRVVLDRPGKQVLLVLSSYRSMTWKVEPGAGTSIKGVLLSSMVPGSTVEGPPPSAVHAVRLPSAIETNNVAFRELLGRLNTWFGVSKVDAFRGTYRLADAISVASLDEPRAELTLRGEQAEPASAVFAFELPNKSRRPVRFRNTGPDQAADRSEALLADVSSEVLSPSGQQAYGLANHKFQVTDLASRQTEVLPVPAGFPEVSWPTALAYDLDKDVVAMATLGGEGYLYRYDAKARRWLDFHSLENVDVSALAYDVQSKRYVAWTTDGDLLFLSPEGRVTAKKRIRQLLRGFEATFDRNNGRSPMLTLVPKGSLIALVQPGPQGVRHIWTYDVDAGRAQLTYVNEPVAGQ